MEFHLTAKKLGVVIFQYNYKEKQKPGVKKKKLKQIQDARDNLPKARCASLISGLQVMQYDREGTVCVRSVAQSCPTLCDPMDYIYTACQASLSMEFSR